MNYWCTIVLIAFGLLGAAPSALPLGLYVPGHLKEVEGNTSGLFFTTLRYQQVYDAAELGAISPPGQFIEGLTFRLNTPAQSFGVTLPDVEVLLSTTSRGPDNLSTNFDENLGSDLTRVIGRGELRIGGAFCPMCQVQGFNIIVAFVNRPFFYDPRRGHLLVEIRNYVPLQASFFDMEDTLGDAISCVISTNSTGSSGLVRSLGLPTFINTRPIPELDISASSTNLLLQWLNFPPGFRLEESLTLGTNLMWNLYQGVATTNESYLQVLLPRTQLTNSEYFRLRWDPTYVTNGPVRAGSVDTPIKLNP